MSHIYKGDVWEFVTENKWNWFEVATALKIDLNEKLDPKQKTIQAFNIDA